jgi:hypothetical protein
MLGNTAAISSSVPQVARKSSTIWSTVSGMAPCG